MKKPFKNSLLCLILISLAVGWRVINHNFGIAYNLELVTTVSVIAAIVIGWKAAVIVPMSSMAISDIFIGNSSIFVFTWSAFVTIGISALLLRKLNNRPKSQIIYSLGFALASSFFFFIITNFGVWSQGWYPATWTGLIECFTMAIPFYRTMLIGNIIMVPTAVSIYQFVKNRQTAKSLIIDTPVC